MNLYQLADGTYVGTQADAKGSGQSFEKVDVPTDKPGLMAYLNAMAPAATEATADTSEEVASEPVAPVRKQGTWLDEYAQKSKERGESQDQMIALEEALLKAPLDTALRLNELVVSRMRDFVREQSPSD